MHINMHTYIHHTERAARGGPSGRLAGRPHPARRAREKRGPPAKSGREEPLQTGGNCCGERFSMFVRRFAGRRQALPGRAKSFLSKQSRGGYFTAKPRVGSRALQRPTNPTVPKG